jgi:hypothetical protein
VNHTQWVIKGARHRSIRAKVIHLVSGLSAIAIPAAVAIQAPPWISAVLGFIAAAGQFMQSLYRDHEQAQLAHQAAVRFQAEIRKFKVDADLQNDHALQARFDRFSEDFEEIKREYGDKIFEIRGQGPPQISGGNL